MAAPAEITTLDISGKWLMNKSLSDSSDEILRLQGVGWMTRKAIQMSSVYLDIKHYKDDGGIEHIDITQRLSGGMTSEEIRLLDWQERATDNKLFGAVKGRSKRINVDEIEDEYMREGWANDTKEHGAIIGKAASDTEKTGKTWVASQSWGFEEIDSERRHTRHVSFVGDQGEVIHSRLVYDYQGPL